MRVLRLSVPFVLTAAVLAQVEPEVSDVLPIDVDSGIVANTVAVAASLGMPQVVWSTVVSVPGASWLRLHYVNVVLAGSRHPGRDGSFLRLTSLLDNAVQTQHLEHVGQWLDTSAYFNGDAVLVELLAYPGTGDNHLKMIEVVAGPSMPGSPDTICGPTDDRTLSTDPRTARNQPGGCTSWMISDCQHCFLTAGHCASSLQILEFNVPLSTASGALQHPSPSNQYALDPASLQTNGGLGVGNDWTYFGVFPNSTTGLTPYAANGGQSFVLLSQPPAVSAQSIRITGYGTTSSPVSPTWTQVQKTHAGPYASFTGTTVRYQTDTTGGNSGSPVILDGTNQAIGIHTHGGCTSTGGSNAGTGSNHAGLQQALANPHGVCACPSPTWSSYGSGCSAPGSAPALQLVGLPALGGTFALSVTGLGSGLVFLLIGLDDENAPLPLPEFAPGCTLLARPDVAELLAPNNGVAQWSLAIPNQPTLAGTRVYEQAIEFGALRTMSAGGVGEVH